MLEKPNWLLEDIKYIKKTNSRIVASYRQLYEENGERKKALVTFTSPYFYPDEKLSHIREIKNYFLERLRNSSAQVEYFFVIELGKDLNNPHAHLQLFFDSEDTAKVEKIFLKTLDYFNLNKKTNRLSFQNPEKGESEMHTYIIKEFGKNLSDKKVVAIAEARKTLRKGKNRSMQFYSRSRALLPKHVYRQLYFGFGIEYKEADSLYKRGVFTYEKTRRSSKFYTIRWMKSKTLEDCDKTIFTKIPEKILCKSRGWKVSGSAGEHCNKHFEYG